MHFRVRTLALAAAISIPLLSGFSFDAMAVDIDPGIHSINGEVIAPGYHSPLYEQWRLKSIGREPVAESNTRAAMETAHLSRNLWDSERDAFDKALMADGALKRTVITIKALAQEAMRRQFDKKHAVLHLEALEASWLSHDWLEEKKREWQPKDYELVEFNATLEMFSDSHEFRDKRDAMDAELERKSKVYASNLATQYSKSKSRTDTDALVEAFRTVDMNTNVKDVAREDILEILAVAYEARNNGANPYGSEAGPRAFKRDELLARVFEWHFWTEYKVSERDLSAAYKQSVSKMQGKKQYNLRIFTTNNEDKALRAIRDLNDGTRTFSEAALKYSDDPQTQEDKGNMGWVTVDTLQGEVVKKLSAQKVGEYPKEPIQVWANFSKETGWSVAMVEGVRDFPIPTLDEARTSITRHLTKQAWMKLLSELVSNAKIVEK